MIFLRRGINSTQGYFRVSPFSLRVFKECPRAYRFRYVDRLAKQYEKPRPWFTMGDNVHATLKGLLSISVERRTPDMAD